MHLFNFRAKYKQQEEEEKNVSLIELYGIQLPII